MNKEFDAIPYIDCTGMKNDIWLKIREHGVHYEDPFHPDYIPVTVTGSFAAVVMGRSPYQSRLEGYHQKSGVMKPKYPRMMNEEILENGHRLEPFVAEQFVRKMEKEGVTDVELIEDHMMYQHKSIKWALADFDYKIVVNKQLGILECKTTNSIDDWKVYWSKGICPPWYEAQVRFYLAVANVSYAYICCCNGFTLDKCAVILIERNYDIEQQMFDELASFVECCELGIEPEMQTQYMDVVANYYTRLYGEIEPSAPPVELPDTEEVYELMQSALTLAERKSNLESQIEALEQEEATIASQLMKMLGGKSTYASYRLDDERVVSITLALPMKKAGFDEKRFIAEQPALAAQYTKSELDVTSIKALSTKVCDDCGHEEKGMRKCPNCGGKNLRTVKIATPYIIPATVNPEKPVSIKKTEIREIPVTQVV